MACSSRVRKKAAQLRRIEIHRVIAARTIQATLLSLEPGEQTEPWQCSRLSSGNERQCGSGRVSRINADEY